MSEDKRDQQKGIRLRTETATAAGLSGFSKRAATSSFNDTYVVIFEETANGAEYERESYTLDELGTVPNVGDILIHDGIRVGDDDTKAGSYTVKEVIKRYLQPQRSENYGPRIVLVVRSRPGMDEEMSILYRR